MMVLFHCESNPGYAAASHELTFLRLAQRLVGGYENIHFAYRDLSNGRSPHLPNELTNLIKVDTTINSHNSLDDLSRYIRKHEIQLVFGFDQPVRRPAFKHMRKAGVRHFISYWGAPMSSINRGLKLIFKKIDVAMAHHRPDHFVFQSEGMRQSAVHGRGIPASQTSVVRTGIDTDKFHPAADIDWYAHELFGIEKDRRIVFFSGHMEARKGVDVVLRSAVELVDRQGRNDVHFLILGNRPGQEAPFQPIYSGTRASEHITFGGYRSDIPELLRSCDIGIIASTGWDSFPMSSIEMAASGLPLVVSDLPGLREAVTPDTGLLFPVSDHVSAAAKIQLLLDNPGLRSKMGDMGRRRAVKEFSVESQITGLETIIRRVAADILNR